MILLYANTTTYAQLIEPISTFRNIPAERYFRFHYDNDYFTKTDEYYSQGITLEYVHPAIGHFPLAKLLYTPFKTPSQYGITFNLFGFTPTSIASDEILYGDRPFNANIALSFFAVQPDVVNKQQIASSLTLGVMGPAALGEQIQTNIHRWLKNPLPHGWQHQIKNDAIVNYQLHFEKQLLSAGSAFLMNATSELRLGTLNNKINAGINFMTGKFNKRYSVSVNNKRKAEYYFYGQGRLNLIGYDAGMQGGLFNRKSAYTIAAKDISRTTFQADAGVVVHIGKLLLSYTQSFLSKEFRTGKTHRWGGVSIGFKL